MTIAQQLKIKTFPFEIRDSKDNLIYFENSAGGWTRREYDSEGREIYFETSAGYWSKREYDSSGNEIYYENSNGKIIDKRSKIEITLKEIAEKFGVAISQIKIKE